MIKSDNVATVIDPSIILILFIINYNFVWGRNFVNQYWGSNLLTLTAFCRHSKSFDDKWYWLLHGGKQKYFHLSRVTLPLPFLRYLSFLTNFLSFFFSQVTPSHSFSLILNPMNFKVLFSLPWLFPSSFNVLNICSGTCNSLMLNQLLFSYPVALYTSIFVNFVNFGNLKYNWKGIVLINNILSISFLFSKISP